MQTDYTEKWADFYQSINRPFAELTELNISTFNKLTKENPYIEDLVKAKKPEEFLSAQMKLANAASLETVRYMQQIYNIMLEATTQHSNTFKQNIKEATEFTKRKAKEKVEG